MQSLDARRIVQEFRPSASVVAMSSKQSEKTPAVRRAETGDQTPPQLRDAKSFNSVLQWRAATHGERLAFQFLSEGEEPTDSLTYLHLHQRARAVAGRLRATGLESQRVLLLYPPGLDFVIGLLACLYAGAIAVPAYPPHPRRPDPRLMAIFKDCQPSAALCVESDYSFLAERLKDEALEVIATDGIAPGDADPEPIAVSSDAIAYLQYTSGSTGTPRGVIVTQGNLLHQSRYLTDLSGYEEGTVHVNWQPFFHDMGLVGSIVFPVYVGGLSYIMAPAAFLRQPIRWLNAISTYRGVGAPGPNFSFELCVSGTTPEQREGLDLSSWKVAWNGAEPIRAETLDRFCEVFEPYGFRRETFLPCYGMAETTLCTTADVPERIPVVISVRRDWLERNQAVPCTGEDPQSVRLVSSGILRAEFTLVIADPETGDEQADGKIGEIWVAGPSVAHGYWQRATDTAEIFGARIRGRDAPSFLRTGDLGFKLDGELYVTGRLKDMIIIRGRNLYPQDLEAIAERSHPALQSDGSAAFSIEVGGQEGFGIALEVKRSERRRSGFADLFEAIIGELGDALGIAPSWLGLLPPGGIPKTSSGKVRRRSCRQAWLAREFSLLAEWRSPDSAAPDGAPRADGHTPVLSLREQLRTCLPAQRQRILLAHLQAEIKAAIGLSTEPDPAKGFERLGIDSLTAVRLVARLQEQLDNACELPATMLFDQPNILALAGYLEDQLFGGGVQEAEDGRAMDPPGMIPAFSDLDADELERAVAAAAAEALGVSAPRALQTDDREGRLRLALAALQAAQATGRGAGPRRQEPIAIVGLSCRFPGAEDLQAYWALLEQGIDAIEEVPELRWDRAAYFDAELRAPGKMYSTWGGFLPDIDRFDADFFDIAPREARSLDPQQRLLLEVVWEALETANLAPGRLRGTRGGVFIGISVADYLERVFGEGVAALDAYAGTGNALSAAAGRLAFTLGWQGPAMAIDTACSSSLVSLHQACASLRAGECDIAVAGGANLILNPLLSVVLSKARMLSPTGRCRTFDAAADGYVRGEGCGVVVLRRLEDAQRDGNPIFALIRGSAVNQDGASSGLTVPSAQAQEGVIRDAARAAGVAPAQIQYLEAHGTGTALGDPIEVQAADAVLGRDRAAESPLLIGSVKSNIGHTEAAAGIAGVIKVVLALQHELIPKTLHFSNPNPKVSWERLNIAVAAEPARWPRGAQARLAGVSSFGFVGTNAHVVLEEAPRPVSETDATASPPEPDAQLLAISARTPDALRALAGRYMELVSANPRLSLSELCFTANTGRDHFEHRAGILFATRDELLQQLKAVHDGGDTPGVIRTRVGARAKPVIAFLFTGQGSQSSGMAHQLYRSEPVFRACFDTCADLFSRLRGSAVDLRQIAFDPDFDDRLAQTGYTQPALYALEASLVALWKHWGVEPDLVLGHSVGEYVAAYVAGVFSLEDGFELIVERARLMQDLPGAGGMAAITAPFEDVERAVAGYPGLSIGAENGADTVISGELRSLDAAVAELEAAGWRCRRLVTSHAFHSAQMEPMLAPFKAFAERLSFREPRLPLISNLTGEVFPQGQVPDAAYWTTHVRQPVKFGRTIETLGALGCQVLLELGPHPVLTGMVKRAWAADAQPLAVASLRRDRDDLKELLGALSALYGAGVEIDFDAAPGQGSRPIPRRASLRLPTYPFQRQRHWIEAVGLRSPAGPTQAAESATPLGFYSVEWEKAPDSAPLAAAEHETWILLADRRGFGARLATQLEASGRSVVLIPADELQSAVERVERTLAEAKDQPGPVTHVVHLASLDYGKANSAEQLWEAQRAGVESALGLVRRLLRLHWEGRFWLVTAGTQKVLDSDPVAALQAPLWGLGKSIAMEAPQLWGGLLDLPADSDPLGIDLLPALLGDDAEDLRALREGARWVARLTPRTAPDSEATLHLDPSASFLITGGLGGIGLAIARRFVERGARSLVLCGRRASAESIADELASFEEAGCKVRVVRADVSEESDLRRLLAELEEAAWPPLRGVVHAAGVDAVVPLDRLEEAELERTLAAKLAGGWLLDRLIAERGIELTMFVCLSSIASVWGGVGQGAYAAANAYLDALADQRRSRGRPASLLNFGPWHGIGMGAVNDEGVAWLHSRGIDALDAEVALDALERVIAADLGATMIARVNWARFRQVAELQRPRPLLERLGREVEAASLSDQGGNAQAAEVADVIRRLEAASPADRVDRLKQLIRSEVGRIIGKPAETVGDDVGFFDLGMDSLMAVELSEALSRRIGRKLPATVVLDRPDIDALTAYVLADVLNMAAQPDALPKPSASRPDRSSEEAADADVEELSDDEITSALDAELKEIFDE